MRFYDAVEAYFRDMKRENRIRSDKTEVAYRQVLEAHAEDVQNRDPAKTGREDVKRTLRRWRNPNTQAARHAALVSFYDWCMTEGVRDTNPARQVRRAKKEPTAVYRLTRAEAAAMLAASVSAREKRISHLGICAGIRNAELRGLQGRHFQRAGFIHVSRDIAKGGRERWVPILPELAAVVADIVATVAPEEYILPRGSAGGWGPHTFQREDPTRPMSSQTLQRTVHQIAKRAGIAAHIHPHLMRHAFADHIARQVGLTQAQRMLGHADVQTTQRYVGEPTLEELAQAIRNLRFVDDFLSPDEHAARPVTEREGFEPSVRSVSDGFGDLLELLTPAARKRVEATVAVYVEHFRAKAVGA